MSWRQAFFDVDAHYACILVRYIWGSQRRFLSSNQCCRHQVSRLAASWGLSQCLLCSRGIIILLLYTKHQGSSMQVVLSIVLEKCYSATKLEVCCLLLQCPWVGGVWNTICLFSWIRPTTKTFTPNYLLMMPTKKHASARGANPQKSNGKKLHPWILLPSTLSHDRAYVLC